MKKKKTHHERMLHSERMELPIRSPAHNANLLPQTGKLYEMLEAHHNSKEDRLFLSNTDLLGQDDRIPVSFRKNSVMKGYIHQLTELERMSTDPPGSKHNGISFEERGDQLIRWHMALYNNYFFFRKNLKRVFRVTPGLWQALEYTNIGKIPLSEFKAPFPCIQVLVPSELNLTFIGRCGCSLPLEGVYVQLCELDWTGHVCSSACDHSITEGALRLSFYMVEKPSGSRNVLEEEWNSLTAFLINSHTLYGNIQIILKELKAHKGQSILTNKSQTPCTNHPEIVPPVRIDLTKALKKELKFYIEMFVKVMLYISSMNALKVNKPPVSSLIKSSIGAVHRFPSRVPIVELGADIIIPSIGEVGQNTGEGGTHQYRYLVRGHWHNYWIKKEKLTDQPVIASDSEKEKVLISKFLSPYWKGPELADIILKDYTAKTKQEVQAQA